MYIANIPGAFQILKDGWETGEMQRKMMGKIEVLPCISLNSKKKFNH